MCLEMTYVKGVCSRTPSMHAWRSRRQRGAAEYVPSWPSNQAQAVAKQFFQSPTKTEAKARGRARPAPPSREVEEDQLSADDDVSMAKTPSYESLVRFPAATSGHRSAFPAGLTTASVARRSGDERPEWGFRKHIHGRHVNNSSVSLSWTAGERVGFGDRDRDGFARGRGRG